MKTALITGVTGQDGSYLAEFLLGRGYNVFGLYRRASVITSERIDHIALDPKYAKVYSGGYGDLTDSSNLNRVLDRVKPDEIYNLGAQSHVGISFEVPEYTADVDALGVLRLVDAIKDAGARTRLYQASTSELFGNASERPQKETTPFHPCSPYAAAKLYAYWIINLYRAGYGLFASNGILFNHESPRRGFNFVTRKITIGVAKIVQGKLDCIRLGNLSSRRDWGFAGDYVEAMWLMLQQEKPADYVIATGESHSVREFCELAFAAAGIKIRWKGEGVAEEGIDEKSGRTLVRVDPTFFRPVDVEDLLGDFTLARQKLGWKPRVGFQELVQMMVESDLKVKWA